MQMKIINMLKGHLPSRKEVQRLQILIDDNDDYTMYIIGDLVRWYESANHT